MLLRWIISIRPIPKKHCISCCSEQKGAKYYFCTSKQSLFIHNLSFITGKKTEESDAESVKSKPYFAKGPFFERDTLMITIDNTIKLSLLKYGFYINQCCEWFIINWYFQQFSFLWDIIFLSIITHYVKRVYFKMFKRHVNG